MYPNTKHSTVRHFLVCSVTLFFLTLFSCSNDGPGIVCGKHSVLIDGQCTCLKGYEGENCEIENLCILNDVECLNEGICHSGTCDCSGLMWGGEHCEDYMMNKLAGNWTMIEYSPGMLKALTRFEMVQEHSSSGSNYTSLYFPSQNEGSQIPAYVESGESYQDSTPGSGFKFAWNHHTHAWNATSFKFSCELKNDTIFGDGELFEYASRGGGSHQKYDLRSATFIAVKS